ncbi:monosaccharide-p-dolichol utilization [Colletotrichum karsti]|uniref:Mannose-P-dolichol utilization defect 1 protein homolog n=1 Tax=Colletotrichum karsti TaxID=1095194 RepID=A0A9P6IA95_9PEZI|nr:monosaccharide-p-dolichol utilization [Colletotrichum karsti]KAF9878647.1 monosaccharide-p-dolichol utilization [Colletotrichum karsti]
MDALRSALQPVTHNLPAPIRDLGVSIIGEHCYKSLLLDINVEDTECIKLGLSKGIGLGIVGVSSIVKLPQIRKLTSSQSGEGISVLSYLLETVSYIISLAYNYRNQFPFSTYGETALIMGQNVIITVLVLNYTGRAGLAAVFVTALAVAVATLFSGGLVDMQKLGYLQAGAGVLSVASKVPQILAIWSEGGTGQLSAFAVFNYLLGSLSRIFTTIQEVDDKLILYNFIAGFLLNAVLASQMAYYWNAPSAKAKGKQKVPIEASPISSGYSTATPKTKAPTTRRRG